MLLFAIGTGVLVGLAAGRAPRPLAWSLATATVVAVLVVALLPISALWLGGSSDFALLAPVGAWVVGLVLLTVLVAWLMRRNRPWWAGAIGLVGALLLLTAVTMVQVTAAVPALYAPREHAWLWYLAAVVPIDFELGGRDSLGLYFVRDVVEFLPAVLTAVLVFVLICVQRTARPVSTIRTTAIRTDGR